MNIIGNDGLLGVTIIYTDTIHYAIMLNNVKVNKAHSLIGKALFGGDC